MEWLGEERHGSFGEACWGVFRQGKARCGKAVGVSQGNVRHGPAWQVEARCVAVRQPRFGLLGFVGVRRVLVRLGKAVKVRMGMARQGLAGQGKSSQGIKE